MRAQAPRGTCKFCSRFETQNPKPESLKSSDLRLSGLGFWVSNLSVLGLESLVSRPEGLNSCVLRPEFGSRNMKFETLQYSLSSEPTRTRFWDAPCLDLCEFTLHPIGTPVIYIWGPVPSVCRPHRSRLRVWCASAGACDSAIHILQAPLALLQEPCGACARSIEKRKRSL